MPITVRNSSNLADSLTVRSANCTTDTLQIQPHSALTLDEGQTVVGVIPSYIKVTVPAVAAAVSDVLAEVKPVEVVVKAK